MACEVLVIGPPRLEKKIQEIANNLKNIGGKILVFLVDEESDLEDIMRALNRAPVRIIFVVRSLRDPIDRNGSIGSIRTAVERQRFSYTTVQAYTSLQL